MLLLLDYERSPPSFSYRMTCAITLNPVDLQVPMTKIKHDLHADALYDAPSCFSFNSFPNVLVFHNCDILRFFWVSHTPLSYDKAWRTRQYLHYLWLINFPFYCVPHEVILQ